MRRNSSSKLLFFAPGTVRMQTETTDMSVDALLPV